MITLTKVRAARRSLLVKALRRDKVAHIKPFETIDMALVNLIWAEFVRRHVCRQKHLCMRPLTGLTAFMTAFKKGCDLSPSQAHKEAYERNDTEFYHIPRLEPV